MIWLEFAGRFIGRNLRRRSTTRTVSFTIKGDPEIEFLCKFRYHFFLVVFKPLQFFHRMLSYHKVIMLCDFPSNLCRFKIVRPECLDISSEHFLIAFNVFNSLLQFFKVDSLLFLLFDTLITHHAQLWMLLILQ